MTVFNIKIISDNICPWCHIGKARLDKAISLYRSTNPSSAADTFNITWSPYYLDPTASTTSMPTMERYAQKFGPDRIAALSERVRETAAADGINMTFAGRTGNTRDSHRVVHLAGTKGADTQNAVVREIMRSYFEQGGDITSWDMLAEAGEKGGLEREEVKRYLEEGKGGEEVDREVEQARRLRVTGVPHFVIQDMYQLGGAQEPGEFLEAFKAVKAREG